MKVFVVPPFFVQEKLCMDNSRTNFARKQTLANIFYSDQDVALNQYFVTDCFVGGERLVPNREQTFQPS